MSEPCATADCPNLATWEGVIWTGYAWVQCFYCDGCREVLGDDLNYARSLSSRPNDHLPAA